MYLTNNRSLVCRVAMGLAVSAIAAAGNAQATDGSTGLPARPTATVLVAERADADTSGPAAAEYSTSVHADLPDAPQAAAAPAQQDQQTKRILGIIPNFRAVSADVKLPPQSAKEKLVTATQDSFDYSTILLPAALAGYSQATNATPEFHQGAAGFARYFWHSYVDQSVENYFVEAIVPIVTRQDSRYYTLGKGGFVKRTEYSLTRVLITRNDAGKNVFNSSEVLGAGIAAGISNLYYPAPERTFGNTAGKWGQSVGVDAVTFMAKEFWPDINRHVFHGKGGGAASPAPGGDASHHPKN